MELNYVTVTLCIRAYRLNSIKLRYTKASCLSRQVSAKPRTSDLYMTPPAAAWALTAERQLLSTRQTDGGRTDGRTDTRPLCGTCITYYAGSVEENFEVHCGDRTIYYKIYPGYDWLN